MKIMFNGVEFDTDEPLYVAGYETQTKWFAFKKGLLPADPDKRKKKCMKMEVSQIRYPAKGSRYEPEEVVAVSGDGKTAGMYHLSMLFFGKTEEEALASFEKYLKENQN